MILQENFIAPQSTVIKQMLRSRDPELVLSGPYQSGKTYPCLVKLWLLHLQHKLWSLVVRKEKSALHSTVIPDFENKVLPVHPQSSESTITPYGGRRPQWYDFANGGRMTFGGMDDASKVLSSAYDIVYFNQCEKATLDDWEKLRARCNGRSGLWRENGKIQHQLLGDCNPDVPKHFIRQREAEGRLKVLYSTHEDNPLLFHNDQWTELGKYTRADLARSLTGLRYERGFLGRWVAAEGVVYDAWHESKQTYDPSLNNVDIESFPKFRAIDFGLKHPFVCLWFAMDPATGILYCYREWRKTGLIVAEHAEVIKEFSQGETIAFTVCDHDAEDNLTLNKSGVPTRLANKSVLRGIEAVKQRLKDGRLFFAKDLLIEKDPVLVEQNKPTSILEEFPIYTHKPIEAHVGNSEKDDLPIKEYDDGLDALRYLVMEHDATISPHFSSRVAEFRTRL